MQHMQQLDCVVANRYKVCYSTPTNHRRRDMKAIKELFRLPSAETMAIKELEAARRGLLEAQSAREYADSLCKYHEARIKRLSAIVIKEQT